jgi:hypothetical protein
MVRHAGRQRVGRKDFHHSSGCREMSARAWRQARWVGLVPRARHPKEHDHEASGICVVSSWPHSHTCYVPGWWLPGLDLGLGIEQHRPACVQCSVISPLFYKEVFLQVIYYKEVSVPLSVRYKGKLSDHYSPHIRVWLYILLQITTGKWELE